MNEQRLAQLLRDLDGPVEPRPEFAEATFEKLLAEAARGYRWVGGWSLPGRAQPIGMRALVTALLLLALGLAMAGVAWQLISRPPIDVLYVGARDGLFVAEGELRELRPLATDGAYYFPHASASGRFVAAQVELSPRGDLRDMHILTAQGALVGRGPAGWRAWSPVADELAVIPGDRHDQLLVLIPDGSVASEHRVPPDLAAGLIYGLAWAHDGQGVVISGSTGTGGAWSGGLWLLDLSTGQWARTLEQPGQLLEAISVSGDGKTAVVARPPGADEGTLLLIDRAGGAPIPLARTSYPFSSIDWSPDGERLVFAAAGEGQVDLSTVRADGSDLRRLTDDPLRDLNPSWSPGGRWIMFTRLSPDEAPASERRFEVWVVEADSSGERLISRGWHGAGWGIGQPQSQP